MESHVLDQLKFRYLLSSQSCFAAVPLPGLRNCCRGEGYVYLDDADIRRMAAYLDLSMLEFLQQYARITDDDDVVLQEQGDTVKSCIFLVDGRCRVHEAKPRQCRDFPRRWRTPDIADYCEGWRSVLDLPPAGVKAPDRQPRE